MKKFSIFLRFDRAIPSFIFFFDTAGAGTGLGSVFLGTCVAIFLVVCSFGFSCETIFFEGTGADAGDGEGAAKD